MCIVFCRIVSEPGNSMRLLVWSLWSALWTRPSRFVRNEMWRDCTRRPEPEKSKVRVISMETTSLTGCVSVSFSCFMWIWTVVGFTGVDQAYEAPDNPEVVLKAGKDTVDECVQNIITHLVDIVSTARHPAPSTPHQQSLSMQEVKCLTVFIVFCRRWYQVGLYTVWGSCLSQRTALRQQRQRLSSFQPSTLTRWVNR